LTLRLRVRFFLIRGLRFITVFFLWTVLRFRTLGLWVTVFLRRTMRFLATGRLRITVDVIFFIIYKKKNFLLNLLFILYPTVFFYFQSNKCFG
jgi:hypothetical protein